MTVQELKVRIICKASYMVSTKFIHTVLDSRKLSGQRLERTSNNEVTDSYSGVKWTWVPFNCGILLVKTTGRSILPDFSTMKPTLRKIQARTHFLEENYSQTHNFWNYVSVFFFFLLLLRFVSPYSFLSYLPTESKISIEIRNCNNQVGSVCQLDWVYSRVRLWFESSTAEVMFERKKLGSDLLM